jgi:hypothetical protein
MLSPRCRCIESAYGFSLTTFGRSAAIPHADLSKKVESVRRHSSAVNGTTMSSWGFWRTSSLGDKVAQALPEGKPDERRIDVRSNAMGDMKREEIDCEEVVEWRRDLHAHPELLYDVHRTASFVATKLKELVAMRSRPVSGGPVSWA